MTAVAPHADGSAGASERRVVLPNYGEAKAFLSRHTSLIELGDHAGARVAICPDWQGRVMTSTCSGPDGPSLGFINRGFIEAGREDAHFNNYGGEDRLWLSPEGGQFSLWFQPGVEQTPANWFTPSALNNGSYQVVSPPDASLCRLMRRMKIRNAAGTWFDVAIERDVRLLEKTDLTTLLGSTATETMAPERVRVVAYESANTICNLGPALTKDGGLLSIWILGMLNAGPATVVIMPYRTGHQGQLGPAVQTYFGAVPPDRLKIIAGAILFRTDANHRSKIGTSQRRAKNILGSIDFQRNVLTLVHFTMPRNPVRCDYLNNLLETEQTDPYTGDVANAYNDGPPAPGKMRSDGFYEIESLSPAIPLETNQWLTHRHCTIHVVADANVRNAIAEQTLGVDIERVRHEMVTSIWPLAGRDTYADTMHRGSVRRPRTGGFLAGAE